MLILLGASNETVSPTSAVQSRPVRIGEANVRVFTEPRPDAVEGRILRKFRGVASQYLVAIQLRGHVVWVKVPNRLGSQLQEQVWFGYPPEAVTLMIAKTRWARR